MLTGWDDVTAENDITRPFGWVLQVLLSDTLGSEKHNNKMLLCLQEHSPEIRFNNLITRVKVKSETCFLPLLTDGRETDAEKCQRWSKQSSGHCKAVMMQIRLYKNQWVVKLKWGCRGEEAV